MWANLKRGLEGRFHQVSVKHLDRYVNKFTFRLNEGNCQVDTADRMQSLFGAMPGKTMTYRELVGKM
ncbi:MAG: transposase [Nitrospira sp.]|nr:transposase [Nitrospira sp.]